MSGLTPNQALRKLDKHAQELKTMVDMYWELIGLTEADHDAYVIYLARMFRVHKAAAWRQVVSKSHAQKLLDPLAESNPSE